MAKRELVAELSEVACKRGHIGQWVTTNVAGAKRCRACAYEAVLKHKVKAGDTTKLTDKTQRIVEKIANKELEREKQEAEKIQRRIELMQKIIQLKQELDKI